MAIFKVRRILYGFPGVLLALAMAWPASGKVHRTSQYPDYVAAVKALKPGDALVCDVPNNKPTIPLPPPADDVQIIGGKAAWAIDRDVRDVIFFNHEGEFKQSAGVFRKCIFIGFRPFSHFTGLDSCLILGDGGGLPIKTEPAITVDGFLRSTSMGHFRSGSSIMAVSHSTVPSWVFGERRNFGRPLSRILSPTSPQLGVSPLKVDFTAETENTNGESVKYQWDFDGNGTVDKETDAPSASHAYQLYSAVEGEVIEVYYPKVKIVLANGTASAWGGSLSGLNVTLAGSPSSSSVNLRRSFKAGALLSGTAAFSATVDLLGRRPASYGRKVGTWISAFEPVP